MNLFKIQDLASSHASHSSNWKHNHPCDLMRAYSLGWQSKQTPADLEEYHGNCKMESLERNGRLI
jgi:hypothetical protein